MLILSGIVASGCVKRTGNERSINNLAVVTHLIRGIGKMQITHNYNIDLLRGVAAFGIVGCHLMLYPKTVGSVALTGLCDMFVGLFAALSGYWMGIKDLDEHNKPFKVKKFISKRARRILPTYIAWTCVYIVFGMLFDLLVRNGLSSKWFSARFWCQSFFLGGSACHLWFLVCLFYSQVFFIVLATTMRNLRWWVCFSVGFAMIGVSAYSPVECWWTYYPLRLFAFLATGCGIAKMPQKGLVVWLVAFIIGLVIHYGMKPFLPQFIRDWFVVVPLLTVVVGISAKGKFTAIADLLGKSSMGVFLVHPIFAAGLGLAFKRFFASPYGIVPWLLDWLCCWSCAFLLTLILLRVPLVKKYVV